MTKLTIGPIVGNQVSATDQVFDTLHAAVISAQLPPGSKVSESEIAKQLGVSRQPVRDAFFRLSNLGFLSIRPQRATLITHISREAVIDAVFTRTALEVECLKAAMSKHMDLLVSTLEVGLHAQRKVTSSDAADFHHLDEGFHEAICRLAGHSHVWRVIRDQKAHLDRIRILTLTEDRRMTVIAEHAEILAAIETGNAANAEDCLRRHISNGLQLLETLKELHPEYFEAPKGESLEI